jgi:hypothetical protein
MKHRFSRIGADTTIEPIAETCTQHHEPKKDVIANV